jgi:hypothetical protein
MHPGCFKSGAALFNLHFTRFCFLLRRRAVENEAISLLSTQLRHAQQSYALRLQIPLRRRVIYSRQIGDPSPL